MIEVQLFSRSLSPPPRGYEFPPGYALSPFVAQDHARAVHRLLLDGYSEGGGRVAADFATWWTALSQDGEYDPELVFVVVGPSRRLVAVAVCWTSAFVKDLVVAREARRKGLASALLSHAFHTFEARGAASVSLKVDVDNAAAISLYRAMGMECVKTEMVRE